MTHATTLTIEEAATTLYLEMIAATVRMLSTRCSERQLVRVEDELARLCSVVATSKFMRFDDEYREEYGRLLDGDKHARF